MQDRNDPYWSIGDHLGPYQSIMFPIEHRRPFGTIWNHAGLCTTIQNPVGPNKYKRDHRVPNVTLMKQIWSTGQYEAKQSYKGLNKVIQGETGL